MVLRYMRIYSVLKVRLQIKEKSGDNSGEATPGPISNTEVKLLSADDTWWEAAWESRTLPVHFFSEKKRIALLFMCPSSLAEG